MDTPDKNRISAVEDSPVFKYINDLSPIEPVKAEHADHILHSLDFASPPSLFCSPQINSYRDSRFFIKRHRSRDLPSPILLLGEPVKSSPDVPEAVKISSPYEEHLKCRPDPLANVSGTKPFKQQISLAIELANSLNNGNHGCDIHCDEVTAIDAENEMGRVGSRKQSDELCRQPNVPPERDPDSDGLLQIQEMEAEFGSGAEKTMFDVVQNSEQDIPKARDPRFNYLTSKSSCSAQVAAGAPYTTLRSSSKAETGLQPRRKQRSVRRRCLTFDVGRSSRRIPLRDSTNDLPLDPASFNKAHSPQKCLDYIRQDTDEILPIPRAFGLHLRGLVNPSVSRDRNKLMFKDGRVLSHGEDVFSTPVSTNRDLVSCDNKMMEEAPERSMEEECFDKRGSCKRCRCRKSKCLKLYCDCFAAGLYCVEPCSCQNCFNRPIHEDMVMKARREIEARNPLAFAPKLVSTSDSASEYGDENSKTPASARHTRGCNCRKSGCLKKYCECFLMGVGCSSSCRCVGCQNIHGHKNEQFHFPCTVESDAVTIYEEAKDHGDYF